jgi:hypothetical protein
MLVLSLGEAMRRREFITLISGSAATRSSDRLFGKTLP